MDTEHGPRCMMTTFSLPAASLRSASRLPAARVWLWISKYLVYIVLSAKRRANFRVESIFLPESREAARPGGSQEFAPGTSLCHNRVTTAEPRRPSHESRQCRRRNPEARRDRVSDRLPGQPDHRGRG